MSKTRCPVGEIKIDGKCYTKKIATDMILEKAKSKYFAIDNIKRRVYITRDHVAGIGEMPEINDFMENNSGCIIEQTTTETTNPYSHRKCNVGKLKTKDGKTIWNLKDKFNVVELYDEKHKGAVDFGGSLVSTYYIDVVRKTLGNNVEIINTRTKSGLGCTTPVVFKHPELDIGIMVAPFTQEDD